MNELPKISSESSIRLTPLQIQSIKSCILEVFGEKLKIYLFGSRTNPLLKGGDIDLFVYLENICTTKLEKILLAKSKIEIKIGEQKIDLVVGTNEDLQSDTFLKTIYSKGILL
jgi:predicted nucleotidyltransferase